MPITPPRIRRTELRRQKLGVPELADSLNGMVGSRDRSGPAPEALIEGDGQDDDRPEHEPFDLCAIHSRDDDPGPLDDNLNQECPRTVPRIEPTPPERLHPPTTAAVMA